MKNLKYKRILLKLSGEALEGEKQYGIDEKQLSVYAKQIKEAAQQGIEIGIVIGGGNIFRGLSGAEKGFDRVKGDQMGMLATIINSLALQSELQAIGQKTRLLTSIKTAPIAEVFSKAKALEAFAKGEVVIIGGGTGNPFFTTDTASILRAVEIEADLLLKGTRVDGVYTADPEKNPDAQKYETISYDEVIDKQLKVMDITAFTMCRENEMPLIVFDMNKEGNLKKLLEGEKIGTLVGTRLR